MKLYKKQIRNIIEDLVGVNHYTVAGRWTDEDKFDQKEYREKLKAKYTKEYHVLFMPKFETETRFVEVK